MEQAQKKSLPQTVIKLADEIYRKGRQEQNAPQMLKAYICRETYQKGVTPDSLYSSLKYMESWAQSERNPVNKAILHSLLAYEYAGLMRKNRRVLLSRTLLDVDEVPEDIREWSISQFVDKIDRYNCASLQDSIRLLDTSAEKYVPFVVLEDGSRFYVPFIGEPCRGCLSATGWFQCGFFGTDPYRKNLSGYDECLSPPCRFRRCPVALFS